jgi:hypothetical protein
MDAEFKKYLKEVLQKSRELARQSEELAARTQELQVETETLLEKARRKKVKDRERSSGKLGST